jgi:imidazolonepropionase-like amidohydrolase
VQTQKRRRIGIRRGLVADIISVGDDRTRDVAALRQVRLVMEGGVLVRQP